MHFTCRSFIGHPSSSNWSQYWENEPDDRLLFLSHGHLFGLINVISSDSADPSLIGHDLINKIDSTYYSDNNHNLQFVISSIISKPEYQNIHLSLIIAVVVGNNLNLLIFNSGEVVLKRNSQISHLLSGKENSCTFLSGPISSDDKLFISTAGFFNSLSWEKVKTFLSVPGIQDVEENFLAHLYSLNDQLSMAGVCVQIHYDEPLMVEEESSLSPPLSLDNQLPKETTNFFSNFLPKEKPVFVSHQDSAINKHRQKINVFISIVLIICLCFSAAYGYRQNQKNQKEVNYQQIKSELNKKIDNVQTLKNLNLDTALAQAKESKDLLNQMSALKIHPDEISQYQQKVSSLLSQTGSIDNFSPAIFYDTSLIINQPHFSQLVLKKNLLFLLDSTSGRIDQIDISKKSTKNISQSENIKNAKFIAENNGLIYLLKDSEIFLVDKTTLTSKIKIIDSVKNFTSGQFGFWNDGIYLLSTVDSAIWRFAPNSTGFTSGQIWLKDGQRLPASPTSLAINGNIWVIGQNGAIIPYTHGAKVDFKPTSTPIVTAAANLTTSLDSDLIAFSDANSSIYVFKKTGESVAHFNLGNRQISSLAIDSASNSIFALCSDQKIYKIGL